LTTITGGVAERSKAARFGAPYGKPYRRFESFPPPPFFEPAPLLAPGSLRGCVKHPHAVTAAVADMSHGGQNRTVVVPVSLPMVSVKVAGLFVLLRLTLADAWKVYDLMPVCLIDAFTVKPLITPTNE
jgi:hypothetical protein